MVLYRRDHSKGVSATATHINSSNTAYIYCIAVCVESTGVIKGCSYSDAWGFTTKATAIYYK